MSVERRTMTYKNAKGTPEERRARYKLALELGMKPAQANRFRDCHTPKIYRALSLEVPTRRDYEGLIACIIGGV